MVGRKVGKIPCGAPIAVKSCAACKSIDKAPTSASCPKCGHFLLPYCERMIIPGEKCLSHPNATERHPDAPTTPEETMLRRMTDNERVAYEGRLHESAGDVALGIARMRIAKAEVSGDEEALDLAVETLLRAQKIRDLD